MGNHFGLRWSWILNSSSCLSVYRPWPANLDFLTCQGAMKVEGSVINNLPYWPFQPTQLRLTRVVISICGLSQVHKAQPEGKGGCIIVRMWRNKSGGAHFTSFQKQQQKKSTQLKSLQDCPETNLGWYVSEELLVCLKTINAVCYVYYRNCLIGNQCNDCL